MPPREPSGPGKAARRSGGPCARAARWHGGDMAMMESCAFPARPPSGDGADSQLPVGRLLGSASKAGRVTTAAEGRSRNSSGLISGLLPAPLLGGPGGSSARPPAPCVSGQKPSPAFSSRTPHPRQPGQARTRHLDSVTASWGELCTRSPQQACFWRALLEGALILPWGSPFGEIVSLALGLWRSGVIRLESLPTRSLRPAQPGAGDENRAWEEARASGR